MPEAGRPGGLPSRADRFILRHAAGVAAVLAVAVSAAGILQNGLWTPDDPTVAIVPCYTGRQLEPVAAWADAEARLRRGDASRRIVLDKSDRKIPEESKANLRLVPCVRISATRSASVYGWAPASRKRDPNR